MARNGSPVHLDRRALLVICLVALAVGFTLAAAGYAIGRSSAPSSAPDTGLLATTADIGFLQDMADHHGQAVLMAAHAARNAGDERVRNLAFNIVTSQASERGQLSAYLEDRGAGPGDPTRLAMAWMGEPAPVEEMTGMVPSEDLAGLLRMRSPELDRRFLELMLVHHEGGVVMAEHALDHVDDPAIADLAGRMIVEQQAEITDIETLLGPG